MATITGTPGNDTLTGTAGNDTISGLGGNDLFLAGSTGGADVVDGGTGSDSIEFKARATSAVVVDFAAGMITGGSSGTISFSNIERVVGGNFNDRLSGNAAGQTLTGQGGADTLWGAGGVDTLWGGAGADTFIFRETGTGNADSVRDFASGSDKLLLDGAVMSALGAAGNFAAGDARFKANSTGTATDASDRIVYNTTTRQVFYDADGNGSGAKVLIATLQSGATLVATDIAVEGGSSGGGQTINGTPGNDSLVGGPGNDTINGLAGNDTLVGLGGDDILDGGAGFDSMDGGAGNDTYYSDRLSDGFNPGDVLVDAGGIDTLIVDQGTLPDGIENLILRPTFDESGGTGNSLNNLIRVEPVVDGIVFIDGAAGNDTIVGGGDAFIFISFTGIFGNDSVDGATGGGVLDFSSAGSAVVVDFRTGTAVSSAGNVAFVGIGTAIGTSFADRITASDAGNTIMGAPGDDTIIGGAGDDNLSGEGGWDHPSVGTGDDSISGGAGNDGIRGNEGNDTLDGGTGDDRFALRNDGEDYDNDIISGGEGIDEIHISAESDVVADLAAGTLTGGDLDGSGSAVLTGIENFTAHSILFGAPTHDRLSGSAAANFLEGGTGNDTIDGRAGNDTLVGDAGFSASGSDDFVFSAAPGAANADLINDFVSADDQIVLDGAVHASSGPSGTFAAGDARFWSSGTGTAHDADDRVIYNTSNGQLWYDADGNGAGAAQLIATLQGTPTLVATDIEVINGSGSGAGQVINGTSGNDTLSGTAGNDTINGLGGNDTLAGSGGSDFYDGGTGFDTLDFRGAATGIAISFSTGTVTGGFNGTFANVERVLGSNVNDSISGSAGGQTLAGQGGADTLWGAAGVDTLWGGGGADTFVFRETGSANADSVRDWASGSDKVALDDAAMSALGASGNFSAGDARFWSSGTGTAHDANDRVVYNTSTGSLYYDADGSGAGAAQLIATFSGNPAVAATDIVVI